MTAVSGLLRHCDRPDSGLRCSCVNLCKQNLDIGGRGSQNKLLIEENRNADAAQWAGFLSPGNRTNPRVNAHNMRFVATPPNRPKRMLLLIQLWPESSQHTLAM